MPEVTGAAQPILADPAQATATVLPGPSWTVTPTATESTSAHLVPIQMEGDGPL